MGMPPHNEVSLGGSGKQSSNEIKAAIKTAYGEDASMGMLTQVKR